MESVEEIIGLYKGVVYPKKLSQETHVYEIQSNNLVTLKKMKSIYKYSMLWRKEITHYTGSYKLKNETTENVIISCNFIKQIIDKEKKYKNAKPTVRELYDIEINKKSKSGYSIDPSNYKFKISKINSFKTEIRALYLSGDEFVDFMKKKDIPLILTI